MNYGTLSALRVPDQKSCDTKDHQGRSQAFERERNDPGGESHKPRLIMSALLHEWLIAS